MRLKDLTRQYNSIKPNAVLEEKTRERILDYFRQSLPIETKIGYSFNLILKPAMVSLLVLFFIFSAGLETIVVARKSLPGSPLYSIKRIVEKSQMLLAFNTSQKTVLRAEILNNRLSEAKILVKRAETGDKESESELNALTRNFSEELKVLKEEIGTQISQERNKAPFPDKDLLNTESLDKGSLPIQDHRQTFAVIPTEDIERLLTETRELLADKNMALALVRIQEVEEIVNIEKPKTEQDIPPEESGKKEIPVLEQKLIIEPIEKNIQSPSTQLPSTQLLNLGSIGQIVSPKEQSEKNDFKVKIERDSPAQTGMIREK